MFGKERVLKNGDRFIKLFYLSVYVDVIYSKFY